eukprot:g3024.t1
MRAKRAKGDSDETGNGAEDGSDRNFYDRYFYNGYSADGSVFFAAAFGVYPHLNVMDGAVSILKDGVQKSIHVSRLLGMERMDTQVGPLSIEVVEPLKSIRLRLEETDGIALDVKFTGRHFPIEEPRFTYRQGPRMLIDCTRMTQNGHWQGTLSTDGETVDVKDFFGTRDRSWGVRPIGQRDEQPVLPLQMPQFYWLWAPTNFPNLSLYFHVNEDGAGGAWNTRSVLAMDGADNDGLLHLNRPKMDMHEADLAEKFAAYAEAKLPGARHAKVASINRIHGGASRQTYSIDLTYEDATGPKTKGLILRRDPPDSLIDTERRVEFAAIKSAYGQRDIPVPEALFLETENDALGAPFFVMGRIESGTPLSPFKLDDIEPHRAAIGEQFFRHLGSIAALPVEGSALAAESESPVLDQCWRKELDYWANEIRSNAKDPQPVAEAAIRHLERNPPPAAQRLSIVHGDYRTGNYLQDGEGAITAILDWEMAHIGDPYEDLAWATDLLCGRMTDIGMILDRIGFKLMTEVAPKLEGDYSGGHAALSGMMAVMAGEAWDSAADRLVNEIAGMRGLLALAGQDVAVPESASVKISDLTEERNALAVQLIDVQAKLEVREDDASRDLNAKIWMHLMATAMNRMPNMPNPEAGA